MTTSLMLKRTDGKIAGYVIQLESSLCYSVKGEGALADLFLLTDDGGEKEMEIRCDAQERAVECLTREITGAVVMIEETIYAFSGEKAKEAFEGRAHSKTIARGQDDVKDSNEKPEEFCKKDSSQHVYNKKQSSPVHADAQRKAYPRWPPPPCWPEARYVCGVWMEENEE